MSKLIKLEGVSEELVVERCQGGCPFNYDCIECRLHSSIYGRVGIHEKPISGDPRFDNLPDLNGEEDIPSNCPLPDYVDENEHTAPDGTVLVAVEMPFPDGCRICYYYRKTKACQKEEFTKYCVPGGRRDGNHISWVPKSEVK